ncbi:TetR family transcriptional regulator [Thermopolyspora flexuosa]|jgi:AcrR family transcriptional regulator|uniref:TetR family transcriptional regulator n=1 Tax=Thermopolyspora flexuosa TaxID=103836 RepID=A0A543IWF8_9ACTN|nr:TetR/AcrR family transcriptional regulator [Thermopolyspora flexuosa]TQM74913.1 TetR family transcriptional regulator [Thermopolyspora flexuosa]GGM79886.1 TetR family transcriptional regulator [Thermopolyspora flexuosa]
MTENGENGRRERPRRSSDRILAAAAELARERGIHGTTIAAVSKRSGLPASSIYWHFADKDELFAEVIRTDFARWLTTVPQWNTPEGTSLRDGLAAILHTAMPKTLREVPDFIRIGMQVVLDQRENYTAARNAFLAARAQTFEMIRAWLDRNLPPETDPDDIESMARFILSFSDGALVAYQADPDLDIGAYVELFLDVFMEATELDRHEAAVER